MMRVMQPEDWERLGRAFAEAREAAGLTQTEVAERIGVSRTPIQAIERGRQSNGTAFSKVTSTMREYAQLLGWTRESPQLILGREKPERAPQQAAPVAERLPSDLPPAIDRELRSGKYVDGAVIHLNPQDEDDDTRIIVVLKSDEEISDEELDRRWQQWRRSRRHLQGIASDPEAPQGS